MARVAWDLRCIYGVLEWGKLEARCHVTRIAAKSSTSPGAGIRFFGNKAILHSILRYSPLIIRFSARNRERHGDPGLRRATASLESQETHSFSDLMEA